MMEAKGPQPMSSRARHEAAQSIIEWARATHKHDATRPNATEIFGSLTFGDDAQRRRLPRDVYKALRRTVTHGEPLDHASADQSQLFVNGFHKW